MPNTIWRVKPGDLPALHFDNEVEADFYYRDMAAQGYAVRSEPIPVPRTPAEFADYLNRYTC